MKRTKLKFIALITVAFFAIDNFAQNLELIPYASWHYGGKLSLRYGEAKFKASENYGAALNVVMPNGVTIQLEYFQQAPTIEYREYGVGAVLEKYSSKIDWYQIGGLKQVSVSDKLAPFGGLTFGAANIRVNDSDPSVDAWAFALTGQIGAKIYISDRIGLRLHARMLMPVQWGGFGFYFGSGGSGTSVNVGSYFLQGDIGAGLIVRLGN